MYKTIYDWSNSKYSNFSYFLKALYEATYNYYLYNSNDSKEIKEKNLPKIREYIEDIEHYLFYLIRLGYVNDTNMGNIIKQISSIKQIKLMDFTSRNEAPYTLRNTIYLNPYIRPSKTLDSKERRFLYSAHEYGHIVNDKWFMYARKVADKLWEGYDFRKAALDNGFNSPHYYLHGLRLLDEVITQDTAENVTYARACKNRPPKEFKVLKNVLGERPFFTNFDFYGDFQELVVKFAKLIDFLNTNYKMSFEEVLYRLSRVSMQEEYFLNKLINSTLRGSNRIDYYLMICALGLIKDARYALIKSNEFNNSLENSTNGLELFNNLSNKVYKKI